MIFTIVNWFRRRKAPTLSELAAKTIQTADEMNEALRELSECDCTDGIRRVMDRARRLQGARTRREDSR